MILHIPTIFVLLQMSLALIGVMFVAAWWNSRDRFHLRTGAAALVVALGLFLLMTRPQAPPWLSIVGGNAVLAAGFGIAWSAARLFEGRRTAVALIFAGTALWLLACAIPAFYADIANRTALISLIAAVYAFACGWEFWRGGDEPLRTRHPLAVLCFAHGAFAGFRALYSFFVSPPTELFGGNAVQSFLMAEPLLAVIAASILGLGLVRERAEKELRRDAETDDLTGVLNRRALLARAAGAVALSHSRNGEIALILFDLDHFKTINDRFGHVVGDRTLRAFARIASETIRESDLFGRIGGEEFAAILPGADARTAKVIAERIRIDFSRLELAPNGVHATVSAGVAAAMALETDVETLFAAADWALYQAKRAGRDQVGHALAKAS